mgnify:CR=1 FL=1
MIDIIAGAKGKGKTKILIQQVNDDIKLTKGTIVYLDKNNKHMYELSNQIRLIVVPEFNVTDTDMFLGFIAGIISQDHDLDKIYLDSFLTTACIDDNLDYAVENLVLYLTIVVDFVISASVDKENMPESVQKYVFSRIIIRYYLMQNRPIILHTWRISGI